MTAPTAYRDREAAQQLLRSSIERLDGPRPRRRDVHARRAQDEPRTGWARVRDPRVLSFLLLGLTVVVLLGVVAI